MKANQQLVNQWLAGCVP